MTLSGRCRCGAVTYTLQASEAPVSYACHCLECQTMSGGAMVLQMPIPEAQLAVEGLLVTWENQDSRGNRTTQRFCAACKTRLYSTNTGRPGLALLRAGTLLDSDQLTPSLHIWARRKQPWIALPQDARAYPEAAPLDVTMALFAPNFAAP